MKPCPHKKECSGLHFLKYYLQNSNVRKTWWMLLIFIFTFYSDTVRQHRAKFRHVMC